MTDVDFVPTKPHQPGEFALLRVPISWLRLSAQGLSVGYHPPRASRPLLPRVGCACGNRENHSANSWPKASYLALVPLVPFHFATRRGGHSTSMFNSEVFQTDI